MNVLQGLVAMAAVINLPVQAAILKFRQNTAVPGGLSAVLMSGREQGRNYNIVLAVVLNVQVFGAIGCYGRIGPFKTLVLRQKSV